MKAYRILLSIVLCLAMVLGMACASAETLLDAGLTLSNVCININGAEVALPYEVRLDAALEDAAAKLHFEVGKDASVYLPVSGEIDASGVRFSLGNSGRVYALDMAMLTEEAGLDDLSAENLNMIAGMVEDYIALLETLSDPANQEKLLALEDTLMNAFVGSAGEETEIEVNGAAYPAVRYAGGVNLNNLIELVKVCSETGIEGVDSYFAKLLDIYGQTMGTEFAGYDELFALLMEETGMTEEDMAEELMDIEVIIGGGDGVFYEKVVESIAVEEGVAMEITAEETITPDGADVSMTIAGDEEYAPVDAQLNIHADLAEGKPTAIQASLNFDGGYDDSDETYVDYDIYTLDAELTGAAEGGLWSGDLSVNYANEYGWGEVEDAYTYENAFAFTGSYAERAEEDGSATSSIALNLGVGEESYGLAFDLNVAASDGLADLFGAGAREYTLSADEYDLAYELLEIDAMGLGADAMEFTADESVLSLMDIFYAGYEYEDDYAYADEYNYDDEYSYEYDEAYEGEYDETVEEITTVTVYSLAEADEIYAGEVPAYTAPEGYELNYVDVDAASLYADYANAEDSHIGLLMIDFGMDMGGDGEVAYYEDENGYVNAAEIFRGSDYILFQFDSVPMEQAEVILSGLAQ